MINRKGVEYLAMMVVKQAYEDYVSDAKKLVAIENPYRSQNTFRKWQGLINRKAYTMHIKKAQKGDEHGTYWKLKKAIDKDYYYFLGRLMDTRNFLEGDDVLFFVKHLDGRSLVEQANKVVEKWADDGLSYATKLYAEL